eukprot:CAMPEP_0174758864 /NCGR_PEP_ID=MMETSP1094-20130205/107982_1 /TAXON_ID=156173 /ORGANISM="Chrysochromulina brevifilum, Strain UTEX LB 985" /LENGTH=178 /DNA_ID=CAMNT_0015964795 /DNA_START=845 /DNA_END=1379 /DNA_ORIENTATION=+
MPIELITFLAADEGLSQRLRQGITSGVMLGEPCEHRGLPAPVVNQNPPPITQRSDTLVETHHAAAALCQLPVTVKGQTGWIEMRSRSKWHHSNAASKHGSRAGSINTAFREAHYTASHGPNHNPHCRAITPILKHLGRRFDKIPRAFREACRISIPLGAQPMHDVAELVEEGDHVRVT